MKNRNQTTKSSIPPGGPSTINGILYQMLWCLMRAVELYVESIDVDTANRPTTVILRLEPRDGGDVQELGNKTRRVIQLKTRSNHRTWSLRETIETVLLDLYRSIDSSRDDTCYDFVTEGRMGRWREVYCFFQSLGSRITGDIPLEVLDNEHEIKFSRGAMHDKKDGQNGNAVRLLSEDTYTEASLFKEIVRYLRTTTAVPQGEPIESTRLKVWHLLSRFSFIGQLALRSIQEEIDEQLLDLVDQKEQIPEKRGALLESLLTHATRGDATIQTEALLWQVGLNVNPLTDRDGLRKASHRLLNRTLELRQYDANADVRQSTVSELATTWLTGPPMMGLEGESGNGKSWCLYSLAQQLANESVIVVLVETTGDADKDLQQAADFFWQDIKGNDGSIALSRIAARQKKLIPGHADSWLFVLIDGVQNVDEAEKLGRQPVEDWGIRLAITGEPEVISVFQAAAGDRAYVASIEIFSAVERDTFLERHLGDHWVHIPSDVKDTLRRPLLASLFCHQIVHSDGWLPRNEYELYDRFWTSLYTGRQAQFPHDSDRLARLALTVLDNTAYPWSAEILDAHGLDSITIDRLLRVGWLRRASQNRFEFYHDRLLNYAVARGLLNRYRADEITIQHVSDLVCEMFESRRTYSQRRLGYVPMDVLHLILITDGLEVNACVLLIEALENASSSYKTLLYIKLLPTLGPSVIPALFERLSVAAEAERSVLLTPIIECIASFEFSQIQDGVVKLLHSDSPTHRRAGVRIVAKRPGPSVLSRLWVIHCEMQDHPDLYLYEANSSFHWLLYEESFNALRACVRRDPKWLERTINQASTGHPQIHDLAYLVANLQDGGQVWRRCKQQLLDKVPSDRVRSIATNISQFRDSDEVERLINLVDRQDDTIGETALHALARIDPDQAVEQLIRLADTKLYIIRGWYMPRLLEVRRGQIRQRLLQHMQSSEAPLLIAQVYQGYENDMDEATVDFLLDQLETILEPAQNTTSSNPVRFRQLDLLAKIYRLELIERFEQRRSSQLEKKLVDFLLDIGARPEVDQDASGRKLALQILQKIGGNGFAQVVNNYLTADSRYGRLDAIRTAVKAHDDNTRQLLLIRASQNELWDDSSLEQFEATNVLAAIGETSQLIEAVMHMGLRTSLNLESYITAPRPFNDDDMAAAFTALDGKATDDQLIGAVMALIVGARRERLPQILDLLASVEPDSPLALACVMAIGSLKCDDPYAVNLLQGQLHIENHRYQAMNSLLWISTNEALEVLIDELEHHYDKKLATKLAHREYTAKRAVAVICERLSSLDKSVQVANDLAYALKTLRDSCLAQVIRGSDTLRDCLREVAFGAQGGLAHFVSTVQAIRGLARLDRRIAFRAARKALEDPAIHNREYYSYLLVELDKVAAVSVIFNQMKRERSSWVVQAMAQALCNVELQDALISRFASEDVNERRAACLIAARRLPSDTLKDTLYKLLDDLDRSVCESALSALREMRISDEIEKLVVTFEQESNPSRQWLLLDALINIAHPGDAEQSCTNWVSRITTVSPPFMCHYLGEKLRDKQKKAKDQANWNDRRQRNS